MVAIVAGNTLGLAEPAPTHLRSTDPGSAAGQNGIWVNIRTGNLILQGQDELLVGRGADVDVLRTYNSRGKLDDDNGDNWRIGLYRSLRNLEGSLNAAGSSIIRVDGDGSEQRYHWNAATGSYVSHDGAGSHDSLVWQGETWTWTDGDNRRSETYDWSGTQGKLLHSTDGDGNRLTYAYAGKLLASVSNPNGEATLLDHDGDLLRQVRQQAADGSVTIRTRYGYDQLRRLTSVSVDLTPQDGSVADGKSFVTTYQYDDSNGSSHRLAAIHQSGSPSTHFYWTEVAPGDWRIAGIRDGLFRLTRYDYDPAASQVRVTDPGGASVIYTTDTQGRLLEMDAPGGSGARRLMRWQWNERGDLLAQTDSAGRNLTWEVDDRGNVVSERDSLGNMRRWQFNALNQLVLQSVAAPGTEPIASLRQAFDQSGRLRFRVTGEGRVTEYRYDLLGQQTASITYASHRFPVDALSAHDPIDEAALANWVSGTSIDHSRNVLVESAWDFRGQLARVTQYSKVAPDGSGIADGSESVTRYVHDAQGRLLSRADPGASGSATPAVTSYAYDGLGRVLVSVDALGRSTSAVHDAAGRRLVVTAANGLVTVSQYNMAGELMAIAHSDGGVQGTTTHTYDRNGNLRSTTDATGMRTDYLYDSAGNRVASIEADGSMVEFTHDMQGNLVRKHAYANPVSAAAILALRSSVDVSLEPIRPAGSADDRVVWNLVDADGRLLKTIDEEGHVTEHVRDARGQVTRSIRYATPLNTALLQPGLAANDPLVSPQAHVDDRVERFFHDRDGLVVGQLDAEGFLTRHEYDAAGRLTHSTRHARVTLPETPQASSLLAMLPQSDHRDIHTWRLYDGQGRLVGEIDGEGYLSESVLDAAGRKVMEVRYATRALSDTATLPEGANLATIGPFPSAQDRVQRWSWDASGQLVSHTDEHGTSTRHSYDNAGNRIRTDRAAGTEELRSLQARYDRQGRLLAELSGEGSARLAALGSVSAEQVEAIWSRHGVSHLYDLAGRRISTTSAAGGRTLFFYAADGRQTVTVNPMGEVTEDRRNALDQVIQTVRYATRMDPALLARLKGGVMDPQARSAIDALALPAADRIETRAFTLRGAFASVANAERGRIDMRYNAFGDLISQTQSVSENGEVRTDYRRDKRGLELEKVDDALGLARRTATRFDAFGRVVERIAANGSRQTMDLDRLGRQISLTDAAGNQQKWSWDAFGRQLVQTDALGYQTLTSYHDADRSVTVQTPEGILVTRRSNRHGEQISLTDGRGNVSSWRYDRNGRLTSSRAADGNTETRAWDDAGNLLQTTDAKGLRTRFTYDAANRVLARRVDPDGLNLTTRYQFNAFGETTSVQDPNGVITQHRYDRKGQLLEVLLDPDGLALRTTYHFDRRGNRVTVTEGAGSANPKLTVSTFDALGRKIAETVDPSGLALSTRYEWDDQDQLTRRIDPAGNATRYFHDAAGRPVFEIDALGGVTRFMRDANGREIAVVRHALPIADPAALKTTAELLARIVSHAEDQITHTVRDADGRVVFIIDALGQVRRNRYDANGNVVAVVDHARPLALPASLTVDAVDSALAAVADPSLDRVIRTYYDAANRPVFVIDAEGGVLQHAYDRQGNRSALTVHADPLVLPQGSEDEIEQMVWNLEVDAERDRTTRFLHDAAGRLVVEIDPLGYVTQTQHDAAGQVIATIRHAKPVRAEAQLSIGAVEAALGAEQLGVQALRGYRLPEQALSLTSGLQTEILGIRAETQTLTIQPSNYHLQVSWSGRAPAGTVSSVLLYRSRGSGSPWMQSYVFSITGFMKASSQYAYLPAMGGPYDFIVRHADAEGRILRMVSGVIVGPAILTAAAAVPVYGESKRAGSALQNLISTAEAGNIDYIDATVTRAATGEVVSKARTHPGLDTGYNGYVRLGTGAELPDGQYLVALRVRMRDGRIEDRPPIRIEHGLQTAQSNDVHLSWSTAGQPAGTLARVEFNRAGSDVRSQAIVSQRGAAYTANAGPLEEGIWQYRISYVNPATGVVQKQAVGCLNIAAGKQALGQTVLLQTGESQDSASAQRLVRDAAGRTLLAMDAAGSTESFEWDALGNRTGFVNKLGARWRYEHDALGRLVTETAPEVAITTITDQLSASTTSDAVKTRFEYDTLGRLVARIEAWQRPEQRITRYVHDALGRQIRIVHPQVAVHMPAANGAPSGGSGGTQRTEVLISPTTNTTWDRFGNAVINQDAAGAISYKVYDRLNRVRFDVDAEGQITEYAYDGHGNQVGLTRHVERIQLAGRTPGQPILLAEMPSLLGTIAGDRTIRSSYDRLGRIREVVEPTTFNYDAAAAEGQRHFFAGKTIRHVHDAFGNVISTAVLLNPLADAWSHSRNWYDQSGNRIAQVDAMGYLTTWDYGADGLLLGKREYAAPLAAAAWNTAASPQQLQALAASLPSSGAHGRNREWRYEYDDLKRLIKEVRIGVAHAVVHESGAMETGVSDAVTEFRYDALGNRTWQKDAEGNVTWTWYDRLGRVTGVATPMSEDAWGLVTHERDVWGNTAREIRHANGAIGVGGAGAQPGPASADDQLAWTFRDTHGRVVRTVDAEGHSRYASHDVMGRTAMEWHRITDIDGKVQQAVRSFEHDKVGRQLATVDLPSVLEDAPGSFDSRVSIAGYYVWTGLRYSTSTVSRVTVSFTPPADSGLQAVFQYRPVAGGAWTRMNLVASGTQQTVDLTRLGFGSYYYEILYTRPGATGPALYSRGEFNLGYMSSSLVARETGQSSLAPTPPRATELARTQVEYNAFGEIIRKGINGYQEYFDYDDAGRLWRTNADDGVDRVILSDTRGLSTAEIRSQQHDLKAEVVNAEQAAALTDVIRKESVRDSLGRVVRELAPSFLQSTGVEPGSVPTLQQGGIAWSINSSAVMLGEETFWGWGGLNDVSLSWDSTADWGDGNVFVTIDYVWNDRVYNRAAEYPAAAADTGVRLQWAADAAHAGIAAVNQVRIYKRDVSGAWVLLHSANNPGQSRRHFTVPKLLEAGGRLDVRLKSGEADWTSARLVDMGRQVLVDTSSLAAGSSTRFEVLYFRRNPLTGEIETAPYARTTGILNADGSLRIDPHNADGRVVQPETARLLDRWGNAIAITTASGTALARHDDQNRVIAQSSPEVEVWAEDGSVARRAIETAQYYDKLGNLVGTRDGNGNLVTRRYLGPGLLSAEYHADGGSDKYVCDLLGRRTTSTNALGKITRYQYDRRDRLTVEQNPETTSRYRYDEAGNRILEEGSRLTIKSWYDTRGRLIRTRMPMGQETNYFHDAAGHRRKELNANGDMATWEIDYFGRLRSSKDLGGAVTTYGHDRAGLLIAQTNTRGQNLAFSYYDNGWLKTVRDSATDSETWYEYDAAGNRTRERFEKRGLRHQDNRISFDNAGRIVQVLDNRYTLTYGYDGAGNRRFGKAAYFDTTGVLRRVENWYLHDSANRIVLSQGVLVDGRIQVNETQGVRLWYDAAGNRKGTQTGTAGAVETHEFDGDNRLVRTFRNGSLDSSRAYDVAGRVVEHITGAASGNYRRVRSTYDANGRLLHQSASDAANVALSTTRYTAYDHVGNLLHSQTAVHTGGAYTNYYAYQYARYDSYKETVVAGSSSHFQPGNTTTTLDVNGNVVSITDQFAANRSRSFVTDQNGRVLAKTENGSTQYYFYAGGKPSGSTASNGVADFDVNYTAVSDQYPAATPGSWVVNAGDTLRSIAQSSYGDAQLWYLIADANGLRSDADLAPGKKLAVPNRITNLHNTSETFKVYNPGAILGDTMPTLPDPPPPPVSGSGGCGGLGTILVAAVAIAVTVVTAGAAAPALAGSLGKTLGTLVGWALGGAAGGIASQATAILAGMQDSLSWSAVAMSAVGGGVAAGVAPLFGGASAGLGMSVASAATSSVAAQGINVLVGLQDQFSWTAVAAASLGAAFGDTLGSAFGKQANATVSQALGSYGEHAGLFAERAVRGLFSGVGQAVARGGRVEYAALAADAFGNVLGSSIADHALSSDQVGDRNAYREYEANQFTGVLALSSGVSEFTDDLREPFRVDKDLLSAWDFFDAIAEVERGNRHAVQTASSNGEDLSPTNATARRLGLIDTDAASIADADRGPSFNKGESISNAGLPNVGAGFFRQNFENNALNPAVPVFIRQFHGATLPLVLLEEAGRALINAPAQIFSGVESIRRASNAHSTDEAVVQALTGTRDIAFGVLSLAPLVPTSRLAPLRGEGEQVRALPGAAGHYGARTISDGGTGTALTGHGAKYLNGRSFIVPEGTSITLPRPNITILDRTGQFIERGDWDGLAAMARTNPRVARDISGMTTWLPGSRIPGYTLFPPDKGINLYSHSHSVAQPTSLRHIVEPNLGCIQWAACTVFLPYKPK